MITSVKKDLEITKVEELAIEVWTEHYSPIIGPDQVKYMLKKYQSFDAIRQQLSQKCEYFLIDQSKGYFSLQEKEDCLFLSKFYVLKNFRGQGLGRRAFDFISEKAVGHNKIKLTVNKNNLKSIAVYKTLGFEISDEIRIDIGNGYFMDDYAMERNVKP